MTEQNVFVVLIIIALVIIAVVLIDHDID